MKNFIFISPEISKNYYKFCECLKKNGINVLGLSSAKESELNVQLKNCLTEYCQVPNMSNYDEVMRAVAYFTYKYGKINWIESNNPNYLELDAKLRKDFNISTGVNSDDIEKYITRDGMKQYCRKSHIPTLRHAPVTTLNKALLFVERVGFPIVIKPDSINKSYKHYEIKTEKELNDFFNNTYLDQKYIMEELIKGDIITYDGICNSKGEVLVEACHVAPSIMNEVNNDDISYYTNIKVSNRLSAAGKKIIKGFDIKSRFFHFEFIKLSETKRGLGKAGRYVSLEANIRPAGGYTIDMINHANSIDIYQLWADMIAFDEIRHTYQGNKHYCVTASRRDGKKYLHTNDEIVEEYGKQIVMNERLPEAYAISMGNEMFTAKVQTLKQLENFVDFVLQKQ